MNTNALRSSGVVKWFNSEKGFGFITPAQGGADIFVHITEVNRARLGTLSEGQRVSYEIVSNGGRSSAGRLALES